MNRNVIPHWRIREILYAIEVRKRKPEPQTWWERLREVLEETFGV